MTFDWHMLYPLHTVILDNSQVFGGVPCKAQLCNCSKWFFSPRFGVVPIWELWQFCYVRIGPPKNLGWCGTPHNMYQPGSSSGTPTLPDIACKGTFCWHFASCCIPCMVRLDQDCQAEAPWCNQGAAKLDIWHGGSHDVSQSP